MFDTAQIGELLQLEYAAFARLRHTLDAAALTPLDAGQSVSIGFIDPYDEGPPLAVELPSGGFVAWVRIDERSVDVSQVDVLTRRRVATAHPAGGTPATPSGNLLVAAVKTSGATRN